MKVYLTFLIIIFFAITDTYSQVHTYENNVYTFEKKLENGKNLKLVREKSISIITLHDSIKNKVYTIFDNSKQKGMKQISYVMNTFLKANNFSMLYNRGGINEFIMYEYNSKNDLWEIVNYLIIGFDGSVKPAPFKIKQLDINTVLKENRENKEETQILRFHSGYTEYFELKKSKIYKQLKIGN